MSSKLRISTKTVPFFTKHAQYFRLPLPRPKRISFGFFVMGVFGKIRKKICAFFFKVLLKNLRIDYILKFVILPVSLSINEIFPYLFGFTFVTVFAVNFLAEKDFVNFDFFGNRNIIERGY